MEKKDHERRYGFLAALLFFLVLAYTLRATDDIPSSDYIRLINAYLPGLWDPGKLLVPDILTRVPITFLFRPLNVRLFHYSVGFDRAVGLMGLLLSMLVIEKYRSGEKLPLLFGTSAILVGFSLNKWEMLLNGSGYPHFLAFAGFYAHFLLLDVLEKRKRAGESVSFSKGQTCHLLSKRHRLQEKPAVSKKETALLLFFPIFSLLSAGPYLLAYAGTLLLYPLMTFPAGHGQKAAGTESGLKLSGRDGQSFFFPTVMGISSAAAMLVLYLLSNHFAKYEYAGAFRLSLWEALTQHFVFCVKFLLNGFASSLFGGELLEEWVAAGKISYFGIHASGAMMLFLELGTLCLYLWKQRTERSLFPLLLLLHGLISHGMVFLSRYIFLREEYAWQSRYALQYQSAVLGMLLIWGILFRTSLTAKEKAAVPEGKAAGETNKAWKILSFLMIFAALTIVISNCYTSWYEFQKAPARRKIYRTRREVSSHLEDFSDTELEDLFEYHHGGERIRQAFAILRERDLNPYYHPHVRSEQIRTGIRLLPSRISGRDPSQAGKEEEQ